MFRETARGGTTTQGEEDNSRWVKRMPPFPHVAGALPVHPSCRRTSALPVASSREEGSIPPGIRSMLA